MSVSVKPCSRILALCLCLVASSAQAEDPSPIVGYVKTLAGNASIERSGQQHGLTLGAPVQLGDRLRTSAASSVGLTLKDSTMLSIGPDSELSIDTYLFEPASDRLGLGARLVRGTLHFVSGIIAKLKPEAVTIETPTATIGVRGTRFVVKADE